MPSLTFWGGVGSVTGANFLFQCDKKNILVDCGLIQGGDYAEQENEKPFSYDPSLVDVLFVTHAHIDHIGRVPKLVKEGFRGVIYSTLETRELAKVMLADAFRILRAEALKKGKKTFYDESDINDAFGLWRDIPYHTDESISDNIKFKLLDAGHILGSSMVEITFRHVRENGWKKIVFCGDLGNSPSLLLRETEKVTGANYMVMDSVYGDRNHEPPEERKTRLIDIINDTVERGGALIIPAFSLERTQDILYEINNMVEGGQIKSIPVFLDSPLAIKVTEIYKKSIANFNGKVNNEIKAGDDIFDFPKLKFTMRRDDSVAIDDVPNPKIVIAGSGMSAGGRVIYHEQRHLSDPKSTILLVGYQVAGSFGRKILEGEKKVLINGKEIDVRAKIVSINGYSAHMDSDHLLEFVGEAAESLEKVFVVMGEPKSSLFLAQRIRDYIGVNAIFPERGKPYILNY
ncbi:MAG: hypothetical protein A3G52_04795 [Candidatus Taylorbacteria bacterium RIFCSPLOWO2_12_FULL_43_20]|uniref:MBL fold hydrolase n=1 Tax=Candidatus Taylorbacteria bacterium RIFCSPLOWO2_12_FULL_43_20 TaxID=1802332 RepID=A0A1G2P2C6_9BACT|nr:MAG: hypothetical protein A2825_02040 [Candidatus Taylorbacteria bacterium RIFCSPHIGHO2_01_FULL_43_120]OHA23473.1 MAG: hypothetical protein A3B98_01340 [Candidatus Taylorbacteria bacterium RIFCSPHIGHO2_02_FULL_43_55]OHA29677.1 MAG: hypothetical protein A3E92_03645 [Candidatus Taylorbacteria bacterium RIFCSPHIGHO2_12_FULL_42_34]OHA31606.1 MAG: hypothetical protein A3B09_02740 [Candidatus Taylorbacteria bacterium RIFCSPLOWO2_01_FULL_43_83]OHA39000.1 MAG: hypothetical protein A3H58_00875 [Candi